MSQEIKACQNCKTEFTVAPDDAVFYQKINVPAPTLCTQCRLQRKLAFRNERTLYKRACNLCKKEVIALYSPQATFPVYCSGCWYGDQWNGHTSGIDFDFSKPFFPQLKALRDTVPHLATTVVRESCTNCDYCSWFDESRDCYLCFGSTKLEECLYSELLYDCKNSIDCTSSTGLERCYECVDSARSYGCVRGVRLDGCTDCYFSFDLNSCSDCLFSVNLRHKNNYILNRQVTPEDFKKQKAEIFGSHIKMQEALAHFRELIQQKAIHKFAQLTKCEASTGNNLIACGHADACFDSSELEQCYNVSYGDKIKDCADCYAIVHGSELCYEVFSHTGVTNAQWSIATWRDSFNIQYSLYSLSSHDLFGCVGLRHAEFSILNKKYDPVSFATLKEKIVTHMKETGEWGTFFPFSFSPFGYNETIANDYFAVAEAEAQRRGYNWQSAMPGIYGKETVRADALADHIDDVNESVLKELIACAECGKNYRIIKSELAFYQSMRLPLPRMCADCRYRFRLTLRTPRALWHRQCTCSLPHEFHSGVRCPHEFETTYAPERPEIVYCEECYQSEIV